MLTSHDVSVLDRVIDVAHGSLDCFPNLVGRSIRFEWIHAQCALGRLPRDACDFDHGDMGGSSGCKFFR